LTPSPAWCLLLSVTKTLTTREAAEALGVTVSRFHRLVAAHSIQPAIKAPGKRGACWWHVADVERLRSEAAA
jgi:excisionase family DNA binding protein